MGMVGQALLLFVLVVSPPDPGASRALAQALDQVHELVEQHRYQDIVAKLEPFLPQVDGELEDPEAAYALLAELGRAQFHMGRYARADELLRRAVALYPQRVETALYLQATAWLTGDKRLALQIFREVLKSGATDLYLAVTLSGEREFVADDAVRKLLDEHVSRLVLDLERGVFQGLPLGCDRREVEVVMGAAGSAPETSVLSASAGPLPIWAFRFSSQDSLEELTLFVEHLVRFTPYRLELDQHHDWRMGPTEALLWLGTPRDVASLDDGAGVRMSWNRTGYRLVVEFTAPYFPAPDRRDPHALMMRTITLSRTPATHAR